ncbi:MAG: hypothetical protein ACXVZ1_09725 [Gaiellaceae bacterium]
MNTRFTIYLLSIVAAAVTLALTFGAATGSSATPASAAAAKQRVVSIVMADPGCHWFSVAGKNTARLVVNGTTAFKNLDEAGLVFKGKSYLRHVAVGKSLAIAKPGVYHITMVGQHPDDNNLVLVVK